MTLPHDEVAHPRGTGGKWVEKPQAEAAVSLATETPGSSAEIMEVSALRDANRERLDHDVYTGYDDTDHRLSLKLLGMGIKDRFPDAAHLVIYPNQDGESQYDVDAVYDAKGNLIERQDNSAQEWFSEHELCPGGPTIQDAVYALHLHDDRWQDGLATPTKVRFEGGYEPGLTIRLDKAAALPLNPQEPQPAGYDPEHHQRLNARIQENGRLMRKLRAESDDLHMQAAVSSVQRAFPGATELRVRHSTNRDGRSTTEVASLRLHDGSVLKPGDGTIHTDNWQHEAPQHEGRYVPALSNHLWEISESYFYDDHGHGYDQETGEIIVRLNHS